MKLLILAYGECMFGVRSSTSGISRAIYHLVITTILQKLISTALWELEQDRTYLQLSSNVPIPVFNTRKHFYYFGLDELSHFDSNLGIRSPK